MTSLHEAALRGSFDVVKYLIENGADLDARSYWGRTALHLAIYGGDEKDKEGRDNCVEALIDGGCNINLMDLDGETGLSYAVERNYEKIALLLFERGADPCGADVHGTTPIHHCIERKNLNLFTRILEKRRDVVESLGLLAWAVRAGWVEGVNALTMPAGVVSILDHESQQNIIGNANIGGWMQPLWNAAYFNQIGDGKALAEVFLRQTADLNAKDHHGDTLLHRLVHWGGVHQTSFITTLLKAGANPSIKADDTHRTPLEVAVIHGNEGAAKALLAGGAKMTPEEIELSVKRGDPLSHMMSGASKPNTEIDANNYDQIKAWCKETGLKFVDKNFRPCLQSLTGDGVEAANTAGRYHDVEWCRAGECSSGALLGPNDAVCGQLGDPFFIATFPDRAETAFGNIEKSEEGVYQVNVNGVMVIIDDFIPCVDGKPQFTCSEHNLMWPLLYEKACAKLQGSFDALSSIRRGNQLTKNIAGIVKPELPASGCPTTRRAEAIQEFIKPCLQAAVTANSLALDEFAAFFMATQKPEKSLDGSPRPMTTVGSYEKYSFPMRTPAISLKVNSDTWVHVEASRESTPLGEKMIVCLCEITENSWRILRATVAEKDSLFTEFNVELKATGNKYIVFAGTPSASDWVPQIELNVSSTKEIETSLA